MIRDISVSNVADDGPDDRVQFPAGSETSHHSVQTGSGAHLASYPVRTGAKGVGIAKLPTHIHLNSEVKNEWALGLPPLPHSS